MGSSGVFCIDCGAANPAGAKFCFACGTPVVVEGVNGHKAEGAEAGSEEKSRAGEILRQRYKILSQIGQGGFGAVYKAEDQDLGHRLVAVKEMNAQQQRAQDLQEGIETFKREALMLAALRHEHLPRIYEHFSENERWYLVMDYIEGETLESHFERSRDGTLPLVMALQIALQLCDVLEYLHNRQPPVIFRDLKPSNIILTPEGKIFLIDFGIARHFKPGQMKDTIAFGSPGYAAPEQYGKAQTTPRADIYSLGSILHQMLSGYDPSLSPFRYVPLSAHAPALQRLVTRMLDMDELARPATIEEVRKVLLKVKENPEAGLDKKDVQGRQVPAMPGARPFPAVPMPSFPGVGPVFAPALPMPMPSMPLVTPAVPQIVHHHHYGMVRSVAWSPDSQYIASATDAVVRVWQVSNNQSISSFEEHHGNIKRMAWSPVGMRIASISEENKVRIWEALTGQSVAVYPGAGSKLRSLAWSHDGKFLAVAGGNSVTIWDTDQSMQTDRMRRPIASFGNLAWSPDGQRLAIVMDNKLLIWKIKERKRKNVLIYHYPTSLTALAWSPDGTYLAAGGHDRTIHTWNLHSEQLVGSYRYHNQPISSLSWSPDSRRIVSSAYSEYINIWDVLSGNTIRSFFAHSGMTTSVAWSPDGKSIVSGGSDRRVCIWKA